MYERRRPSMGPEEKGDLELGMVVPNPACEHG